MPLPVGSAAPDFTLKCAKDGQVVDVTLSSHHGSENVVLLFYPGAFTPVCQKEMCSITDGLGDYHELNAAVYGISGDTQFALAEWAKQFGIAVPLLADYQRSVTRAYNVTWPNFAGLGEGVARAVFVIDKEGIIRYAEQTPTLLDLPHFDAVQECLRGL